MSPEQTRLAGIIQRKTGIVLGEDKTYILDSRLNTLCRDHAVGLDDLCDLLERTPEHTLAEEVLDRVATHETRFFRDESIFDALVVQILPEWLEKRGITAGGPINAELSIWSAGCSTGQEPYSLAILLQEMAPRLAAMARILATDMSGPTLELARRAEYTEFELGRGMPPHLLRRYFESRNRSYVLRDEIRRRIRFERHNLCADPAPGLFDVILCRNVCIYFTEEKKREVYGRLVAALKTDGVLILGSAEGLSGYVSDYVLREFGLARYYELNNSRVTMFLK